MNEKIHSSFTYTSTKKIQANLLKSSRTHRMQHEENFSMCLKMQQNKRMRDKWDKVSDK